MKATTTEHLLNTMYNSLHRLSVTFKSSIQNWHFPNFINKMTRLFIDKIGIFLRITARGIIDNYAR